MAPQDQRKPRNNARKAAVRALQRQRPELSYHEALAAVTESAGSAEASNPLHIRSLLKIASPTDIAVRHSDGQLNLTVPVGLNDAGETVTLDIAQANASPNATGPHGAIAGPASLHFALAFGASLRANNSAEHLEVVFAGSEQHGRTATPAVDYTVPAPWHAWLRAQLAQRSEAAQAAQVTDLPGLTGIPNLVVLAEVDETVSTEEAASLEHAVRTGRSLGVHIIVVCPYARTLNSIRSVPANLTFVVTLRGEDQRRPAAADTVVDNAHFSFTPAQFSAGELTRWITAARMQS